MESIVVVMSRDYECKCKYEMAWCFFFPTESYLSEGVGHSHSILKAYMTTQSSDHFLWKSIMAPLRNVLISIATLPTLCQDRSARFGSDLVVSLRCTIRCYPNRIASARESFFTLYHIIVAQIDARVSVWGALNKKRFKRRTEQNIFAI